MEFIKISRQKTLISGIIHTVLNILLVAAIWLSISITGSPYVAFGLVIVSKWRVFLVRPRFWMANIKSNLVDLVVGLSLATLIWLSGGEITIAQMILAVGYTGWLVIVKPRSSDIFVIIQSLVAVFVGFFALFSIAYAWPAGLTVLGGYLIGYSSLRHALSIKEASNLELFSIAWGLFCAEITWIFSHWTIGYMFFGGDELLVPQASIILSVLSFLMFMIIKANKDDKIKVHEVVLPLIFSIVVCFVLLVFFSGAPEF